MTCFNNLNHDGECNLIAETVIYLNEIVKRSMIAIFHADIDALRIFGETIKSDNILMLYSIQKLGLSSNRANVKLACLDLIFAVAYLVHDFFLGDLFDGAEVIILGIPACKDSGKGARSKTDGFEMVPVVDDSLCMRSGVRLQELLFCDDLLHLKKNNGYGLNN